MGKIDEIDIRILRILQNDSTVSIAEISERVALSQNACWRRIKQLERDGIIKERVAILDARSLHVGQTVFVAIQKPQHSEDGIKKLAEGIQKIPEVQEFHRLSGNIDYLLKMRVKDVEDYDRVYKNLVKVLDLNDVSSFFVMETLKSTTALNI